MAVKQYTYILFPLDSQKGNKIYYINFSFQLWGKKKNLSFNEIMTFYFHY